MSPNKRTAKPPPFASKDLPKIVSFFSQRPDSGVVDRTSYIIRPSEKKPLATIITDVATAMHLPIDSDGLSVYDLNGSKIRTFRKLYDHTASTFILKNEANLSLDGDVFEHAGFGPKLKQSKDHLTSYNWIYGNSKLIEKQPKPLKKPENGKKRKSRPLEKKNAKESSTNDINTEELHSNEAISAREEATDEKKDVATEQESGKEPAIEKPSAVTETRPCPVSQIEARLAQVRTFQDQMMQGESYLDKIGHSNPKHNRYNPFVLFGGDVINWEDKKEEKKEESTISNRRPPSAIPKFTASIPNVPDESVEVEEADNDHTSSKMIRPQTVTLRRANPKLRYFPEVPS